MKNVLLLCALVLVGGAACAADGPTGSLPGSPRKSALIGAGFDTPPDTTKQPPDSTKQGG